MRCSWRLLALLGLLLIAAFPAAQSADNDGDGDSTADDDGEDDNFPSTGVGALPPNALVGCVSPYTYIEAQSRMNLATYHALIESDPTSKAAFKYLNFSGTVFVPTDAAFANLTSAGTNVTNQGTLTTASLQSLLQYSVIFDALDPTTLLSLQGNQTYQTALALSSTGENTQLSAQPWQFFTQQPGATYQNVTVSVASTTAASSGPSAPLGTYKISGGNSTADIIYTGQTQPVRTCTGYIYLVDGVLLPKENLTQLGQGGNATTNIEAAGESEGSDVTTAG